MKEKKDVRVGLGTFTLVTIGLIILVVVICGFIYFDYVGKANNNNKPNRHSSTTNSIVGSSNTMNTPLNDKIQIDVNDVYAFACKSVITGSQYESENTLIALNKKTGEETKIMKFDSGAYTYHDNKIYFYENTANSYHRFYVIDLGKPIEPKEIYSFEYRYAYTDNLEYYNNKLYYTFDGELRSLSLEDNQVEHIAAVKNYIFFIDQKNNRIFYINEEENLCEMNLLTEQVNIIDKNTGITNLGEDKLIYIKVTEPEEDSYEHWYWEYDLKTGQKKKIAESWGGEIGKDNIVRYSNNYLYINGEGQLILIGDNDEMTILTDEGGFSSLTILTGNRVLLERNEAEDEGEDIKTYIYDMNKKQINATNNNYRYSYIKNI